jgi:hypothetical protein
VYWSRGESAKSQKSRPFGSGTLKPPSRPSVTDGLSAYETIGPRNFAGAGAAPAGVNAADAAMIKRLVASTNGREKRPRVRAPLNSIRLAVLILAPLADKPYATPDAGVNGQSPARF